MQKAEIPYTIYSGVQFFGRVEIKDALSYLRMIAYQDDLSFLRIANVPKRNLGERRMNFLKEYARPRTAPSIRPCAVPLKRIFLREQRPKISWH